MKKITTTAALLALACNAYAAGSSAGTVGIVVVNASNYLFFTAGTKTGSPGCDISNQWSISLDTAKGRSIYAMVLTAQSSGRSLNVVGDGTCSVWPDRENVLYVYQ